MIGRVLRIRYELTQPIGESAVFLTFAARDRVQGRDVCARIVRQPFASEPEFVEKLRTVIAKFATVSNPWIESIAEVDEDEDVPFLLGALSSGMSLSDRIRRLAPFSVPVSVGLAISICKGLEGLHKGGLVHGDVGAHNVVALADGSARLQLAGVWESYSSSATAGAVALPAMAPYLAPEVSAGSMPTPSSDVYALGVILYELLTGRQPYVGETPVSTAMKHATSPTPSARASNPSIPLALDEMVRKAMHKEPAQRYPDAAAMLTDLRTLQDALRFGKSLAWPLAPESPTEAPEPIKTKARPVAAERKERPPRPAKQSKPPADVPIWLVVPAAGLAGAILLAIGAYLVYNIKTPPLVAVPNLKNMLIGEARNVARGNHLEVKIGSQETNDKIPADTVISTNPAAGEKVREGFTIVATVSSGGQVVEVPDLRGLTVDGAKTALGELRLKVDEHVDRIPSDQPKGLVVNQVPDARTQIDRSQKVHIQVSNGQPPSEESAANKTAATDAGEAVPTTGASPNDAASPSASYMYSLKIHLTGITAPVNLRVDMTDDEGSKTIFSGRRRPAETVELHARGVGQEATFLVYYDDVLVTEVVKQARDGTPTAGGGTR